MNQATKAMIQVAGVQSARLGTPGRAMLGPVYIVEFYYRTIDSKPRFKHINVRYNAGAISAMMRRWIDDPTFYEKVTVSGTPITLELHKSQLLIIGIQNVTR